MMRFSLIAAFAAATAACSAPPPENAAPEAGVSAQMLLGTWGDNGDCTRFVTYAQNGSFQSYTGGEGRWRLEGDALTMEGAQGPFTVRLQRVDDATVMVINPDGTFAMSRRC